ncbi:MAG: hypothetical protein AVO35_13000 [Candidatus Aegiribacteria sp. MLS_C]|nr:MAG: hypothetical protein AVO35_13000 [Candidatus Aegiribacteria sp. MLS_C]
MNWFEKLTGFTEESPQQVRANLSVDGSSLKSHINGKAWICGELEIPSLGELRERSRSCVKRHGRLSVREVVADVQHLHMDESNAAALFQVASQFNLLEMVSSNVIPEKGVGIYEHDHTQGPACAIAAGAGTIYRNYFADVNGQTGQSANNQIDCLADIGAALGNSRKQLWKMINGYAMPSRNGLMEIAKRLESSSEEEIDRIRQKLRIGIQWNTQVTLDNCTHLVSQAYCSALPVACSRHSSELWADFARLVLDSSYEATLCAAVLNAGSNGSNRVFLTLLGGGAFGNETDWITGSIHRALNLCRNTDLDVSIVSYGRSDPRVKELVQEASNS